MISKDKARVAVTLTKDVIERITALAENEKRTISAMTAILIEEALETHDAKY